MVNTEKDLRVFANLMHVNLARAVGLSGFDVTKITDYKILSEIQISSYDNLRLCEIAEKQKIKLIWEKEIPKATTYEAQMELLDHCQYSEIDNGKCRIELTKLIANSKKEEEVDSRAIIDKANTPEELEMLIKSHDLIVDEYVIFKWIFVVNTIEGIIKIIENVNFTDNPLELLLYSKWLILVNSNIEFTAYLNYGKDNSLLDRHMRESDDFEVIWSKFINNVPKNFLKQNKELLKVKKSGWYYERRTRDEKCFNLAKESSEIWEYYLHMDPSNKVIADKKINSLFSNEIEQKNFGQLIENAKAYRDILDDDVRAKLVQTLIGLTNENHTDYGPKLKDICKCCQNSAEAKKIFQPKWDRYFRDRAKSLSSLNDGGIIICTSICSAIGEYYAKFSPKTTRFVRTTIEELVKKQAIDKKNYREFKDFYSESAKFFGPNKEGIVSQECVDFVKNLFSKRMLRLIYSAKTFDLVKEYAGFCIPGSKEEKVAFKKALKLF